MKHKHRVSFTNRNAQVQYAILMGLFRVAVTRGLFGRFARGLGLLFPRENAAFLDVGAGHPFKIYLNDGYWTRFGLWYPEYEPEVARAVQAAAPHTPLFCDLGANKGYWTVQVSSLFQQVLAVEASADTFKCLHENAGRLRNVTLRQAAIHARSGEELSFVNVHNSHASARLLGTSAAGQADVTESVTTVAIDDLVPPGQPALIKLDVEGAEVDAFDGARRTLSDGSVFLYEDHGADRDCVPSAYLLNLPDIRLYSTLNGIERLTCVDQINALKIDRFKGYNFLAAHKSSLLLRSITEALQNPGDRATSVT